MCALVGWLAKYRDESYQLADVPMISILPAEKIYLAGTKLMLQQLKNWRLFMYQL